MIIADEQVALFFRLLFTIASMIKRDDFVPRLAFKVIKTACDRLGDSLHTIAFWNLF